MADHNLPTITSTYSNFVTELDARLDDITRWLGSGTITNLPDGAVKWNSSTLNWQKWSIGSSTWSALSTAYNINIDGIVGANAPAAGTFTALVVNTSAALPAGTTIGTIPAVTTTTTQTLSNKTLTTPTISSIFNVGTLTLPTLTDTLVGRTTVDTLSNKTLTAPKFADLGFIADPNGNEMLLFDSVANAVNYVRTTNSITNQPPTLEAEGDDSNIDFNLKSKGTGTVKANGFTLVDVSNTQTLTNKTLGTNSKWNGNTVGVIYGGTGTATAPTTGGIAYGSSASAYATSVAGTSGQLLQSNGTAAPTWVSPSSLNVSYAETAGRAYPRRSDGGSINFNWSGQSGQPTWVWGGSDGTEMYVYNPANFNVNSATLASTVTINYSNNSDSTYQMLWGSGNSVYGTSGIYCNPYTDSIYADGNVTAYSSSDASLKENIVPIQNALNIVKAIGGKTFDWTEAYINRNGGADGYHIVKHDFGVIAQDVLKNFPLAVRTRKDGTLAVDYVKLCSLAFAAISDLSDKLDQLQDKLNS